MTVKMPRAARGAKGAGYNIMPPAGTGLSRPPLPHTRHLPSTANDAEKLFTPIFHHDVVFPIMCKFPIPYYVIIRAKYIS